VLGPLNFAVRMAIDPDRGAGGRIHLVWIRATSSPSLGGFGPPPNPIVSAYSDDGGRTFTEPLQVSDPARERVVAPALAIGPEGAVHVAYYDLGRDAVDYQGLEGPVWPEPWSLVLSSSLDGGRTFTPGVVVDDAILPAERVMLIFTMAPPALVAGRDGLVCAAWTDARNGDPDALSRCSDDQARSWRDVRRLNDDPLGNGASQYLPRLALSADNRLDAVFFDRREDPRNVLNHVYLTYSTDGGRGFAPNLRISSEPSDPRIGQQYVHPAAQGLYEIGARLGLLSQPAQAVAAWPDTRHWTRGTTGQDLVAATIALPKTGGRPVTAVLVAAGLLLTAAAVTVIVIRRRRRRRTRGPVAA
jgi:LPXTG-motif cell wall-anchored protein